MAGKKTGKRLLTWVLVLVMALSLLPLNVLASGEGGSPHEDVVNGYYDASGTWKQGASSAQPDVPGIVSVSKTAARAANTNPEDNTYDVTLRVETEGIKDTNKAATVLVIDTSASMDECMKEEHTHNEDCYTFTGQECTPDSNPSHWRHIGISGKATHKYPWEVECNYDSKTGNYYITDEKKLDCNTEVHSHNDGNCYTRLDAAKKAAIDFLDSYRNGAQSGSGRYVALVAFNVDASNYTMWMDVSSSADYTAAKQWINGLSANGGTNLDAGLSVAGTRFSEAPVSSIAAENRNIIVLTDGEPTYCLDSDGDVYGWGSFSTFIILKNTNATAKDIRDNVCPIHTICFAADNETIYDPGFNKITLSEYLKTYIASDGKAYNASSYDELTAAFSAISDIITSHLTEAVVHDSLPTGVTAADSTFNSNGEVAWSLFEDFEKEETAGGTTVYTKTYTVTIDPETAGKADGKYCPLNGPTTLTVKSQSTPNGATLPFPIPAGLVTVPSTPGPEAPDAPNYDNLKTLIGDITVNCTNTEATHSDKIKTYALIEDSYTSDGVKGDAENGYTYTVTIKSEKYVNQFDTDTGAVHTPKNATATVTLEYKNNAWLVKNGTPISFNVVCDAAPTYPVYVYAFFAHDNTQLTGDVTVNGKPIEWNEDANNEEYKEYFVTLGVYRNGTTQEPTDGATGLVLKDLNVTEYELAESTSKGNGTKNGVTLTDITSYSSPSGKVCSGAAGYPESDGELSWHLDGQVNVYTVTYDYNGGTAQGAPTSAGYYFRSYTIADAPERDGYTFTGWKDGDTTYRAGQEITLSKDLKLVAQWKENTIPTYKFDLSNLDTIKVNKEFKSMYGLSATRSFTATATIEKETYTAEVDPNSPSNRSAATAEPTYIGKAIGTVTLKTDTTKAFDFGKDSNGKDSKFQLEPGDYRITVEETNKGNDRYVNYDTEPYTHTYEFTVDNKGQISIKTPITFTITNEYTKRHTAATPSKPTLNTGDHYAYVMGYPDGTVRPNGSITRAEVSAILFRLLSDKTRDEYFTTESSFTDVKAGAWYNNSIATLEKAGVIVDTAKGGAFRPNEAITRAELAAMLAQFSDAKPVKGVKFSDVSAEHWAYEAIAIAAKMGWIEGYPDGTFRPDATITRAEMMTLVNRALERVPSDEDHLLSKRVMLTFPDCKSGDWFYIAVQEATNSHTYERAATEKNGDEQWTALRANRDWTLLEK